MWLVLAVAAGLALQLAVVTVGPLQRVFGTAQLEAREWILVLAGGAAPAALMTIVPRIRRLRAPAIGA
ncbi:MAG: cation transporting ATPase C-terminal domain-containing protein [Actinomycetota bacterium]